MLHYTKSSDRVPLSCYRIDSKGYWNLCFANEINTAEKPVTVCFQLFQRRRGCFVVSFLHSVLVHNSAELFLKKVINSLWSPSKKNCPKTEREGSYNSLSQVHVSSPRNWVHDFNVFYFHFNIILLSMPGSSKRAIHLRFPFRTSVQTSSFSLAWSIPHSFEGHKNICEE